jgi:DNA-binding IclR family transcriptional regulator
VTDWSFLTNHARALLCIAHDPGTRLIDVAATLGITERSAYAIVNDLTTDG